MKKVELEVSISVEAVNLLDKLVEFGIYGCSAGEVAARFVELMLQSFVKDVVLDISANEP